MAASGGMWVKAKTGPLKGRQVFVSSRAAGGATKTEVLKKIASHAGVWMHSGPATSYEAQTKVWTPKQVPEDMPKSHVVDGHEVAYVSDKAHAGIAKAEERIAGNRFESMVVFDPLGNPLYQAVGGKHHVSMPSSKLVTLKSCVMTHNHPSSGGSFSPQDVMCAVNYSMREIRTVGYTPEGKLATHVLRRPAGGWHAAFPNGAAQVAQEFQALEGAHMVRYKAAIHAGTPAKRAWFEFTHGIWEAIAQKHNLYYTRTIA
jgi:hypothetical protein